MRSDINKLRELTVASIDAAIIFRRDKTAANLKIASDAQDNFNDAANEMTVLHIIAALQAANKRIAELETVNSKMKDDVRRGRRIIADLEDDHS